MSNKLMIQSNAIEKSSDVNPGLVLMIALGFATGLEFLENTMVLISAGNIQRGIGATAEQYVWTTAAYATAAIIMILLQHQIAETMTYRRFLPASLLLYAVGTALCAHATTPNELIVARGVQGAGGGTLFTSCRILVRLAFTPEERTRAARVFTVTIFGFSGMAPLVASQLIATYKWNAIFEFLIPLILLAALYLYIALPEHERQKEAHREYDYWPIALFATGVVAFEVVMQKLRFAILADSPSLIGLLIYTAFAWGVFVRHQQRAKTPVLYFRKLRSAPFTAGLVFFFLYYFLIFSYSYLFPIFCERVVGYSAPYTGKLLFLTGVTSLIGVVLYQVYGSKVTDKRWLMCAGLCCSGIAMLTIWHLASHVTAQSLYAPLLLKGFFGALLVLPVAGLTFQEFDDQYFAHAYRLKNIVRQICATFAVAAMTTVLRHRESYHQIHAASTLHGVANNSARVAQTAQRLMQQGHTAVDAQVAAIGFVGKVVGRQVLMMSFGDAFLLLSVIAFVVAVIVPIQRWLK